MRCWFLFGLLAAGILVADEYALGPDSQRHDGVPRGSVTQYSMRLAPDESLLLVGYSGLRSTRPRGGDYFVPAAGRRGESGIRRNGFADALFDGWRQGVSAEVEAQGILSVGAIEAARAAVVAASGDKTSR
jgi:hypothetical protein